MRYPANQLWGNDLPVCPYCNEKQDLDDLYMRDGNETQLECIKCKKKFRVQAQIKIEYSTVGDCMANNEMPHKLKKGWSQHSPFECLKCRGEAYDWELEGGRHQNYTKNQYEIEPPDTRKDE